jgi:hypothetical protein
MQWMRKTYRYITQVAAANAMQLTSLSGHLPIGIEYRFDGRVLRIAAISAGFCSLA